MLIVFIHIHAMLRNTNEDKAFTNSFHFCANVQGWSFYVEGGGGGGE